VGDLLVVRSPLASSEKEQSKRAAKEEVE